MEIVRGAADKEIAGEPPSGFSRKGVVMDVNTVSAGASARDVPASAPAEVIPTDQAAENREVVRAVKALNAAEMFGDENELTFQRDTATRRMVVRVINRHTGEVVSQIPPEYVLRLAEDLPKTDD